MEFITGKQIHRRGFGGGMGGTVGGRFVYWIGAAGRLGAQQARAADPTRLVAIESVHGAAGSNDWGATQHLWAPADVGRNFELTPSALLPLDEWRDYLTIISNTDVRLSLIHI